MNPSFTPHIKLEKALADQSLFAAWLGGGLPSGESPETRKDSAAAELRSCLDRPARGRGRGPAPLFAATQVRETEPDWVARMSADLPFTGDRELFRSNLDLLLQGRADVVVTGQQPGALGGPLYTLYKIATAIALARQRTDAGRPTVPVFWSGDDDDDLLEAMAVQAWDPLRRVLFGSNNSLDPYLRGRRPRPCVGNLSAADWCIQPSAWLNSDGLRPLLPTLGRDLAHIWAAACAEEWSWARLNRRFLLRVFRDSGLVVLSGHDSFLHGAAAPLYRKIMSRRDRLVQLARRQGTVLAKAGHPVPVNERSLQHHLYVRRGAGRVFLETTATVADPVLLRPGVMLRNLVQDFLLQPAAVVVGPGELAYLQQLAPLYGELSVAPPCLVPRLCGWIVPEGFAKTRLAETDGPGREAAVPVAELAGRAARVAEDEVRRILGADIGVPAERAALLAGGRGRRWRRSLAAMFRNEVRRRRQAEPPVEPAWVFPGGKRQERVLSALGTAALWGEPLAEALVAGAREHLRLGVEDDWREFVAEVDEKGQGAGT